MRLAVFGAVVASQEHDRLPVRISMTGSGHGIKIQISEIGFHYTAFWRRFTTFFREFAVKVAVSGAKTNSFLRNLG